jgi:hypothetical protein
MKLIIKHFITLNNKKYFYTLKKLDKDTSFVECKGSNIAQEFLNEDIPQLLNDLPRLILAEKDYHKQQSEIIRFRVSPKDKKQIEKQALKKGYSSVSSFLRDLALRDK